MLRTILTIATCSFILSMGNAQTKVGSNVLSIDPASILELESDSSGFLPSRLTTVQRDAQSEWDEGHIIYNTTDNCLQIFDGSAWDCFVQGVQIDSTIYKYNGTLLSNRIVNMGGFQLTFDGSGDVVITDAGFVGIGDPTPDAKLDVEDGTVRFSDYGKGNIPGPESYLLGVDSDGDVVEVTPAIDTFSLIGDELRISLKGDTVSYDSVNLAKYLDDINVYEDEGTLTGNRTMSLNGNWFRMSGTDSGANIQYQDDGDIRQYGPGILHQLVDTSGRELRLFSGSTSYISALSDVAFTLRQNNENTIGLLANDYLRFYDYGDGLRTGTPTYILGVDADGDVLDVDASSLGTDDQILDSLGLTGTILEVGIEDDANGLQSVDLSSLDVNIYNTSDTLEGNRTVELDGSDLTFGATSDVTIKPSGYVGIGDSNPSSELEVNGLITGGFGARTTSGILDWNDATNARSGNGNALLLGTHANGPGMGAYFHPFSFEYNTKTGGGNMNQLAIPYNSTGQNAGIYMRTRYSGVWQPWTRIISEHTNGNVGIGTIDPMQKFEVAGGTVRFSNYGTGVAPGTESFLLGVEADGDVVQVDPSTIGTDDQILDSLALTGTMLEIGIENDANGLQTLDLSSLTDINIYEDDGTLTADRTVGLSTFDLIFDGTSDVIIKDDGKVGIGLSAPERPLHVNEALRLSRGTNTTSFIFDRYDGSLSTIWKSYLMGVNASALGSGEFFIADYNEAVSGGGFSRMFTLRDATEPIRFDQYNGSTFVTGMEAAILGVEADGDIVEVDLSSIIDRDWNALGGGIADNILDTIYTFGLVGINTNSPQAPLHVIESTDTDAGPWAILEGGGGVRANTALRLYDKGTASNNETTIEFAHNTAPSTPEVLATMRTNTVGTNHVNGADLTFETTSAPSSVNTDQLVLKNNGNVGIGTRTPDELLHVAGSMRLDRAFEDKDGDAGTSGQVLTSTGIATDWVDSSTLGSDDQIIDSLGLDGNTLNIGLEGDVNGLQSLDLTSILGNSENIYNTSDALDGDRVVTLDGNSLTFDGAATGDIVIAADGDISIGTATASGDLNVVSDENQDGFHFTQTGATTGEIDVFTIQDQDVGGGGQDGSSVLKVIKSGSMHVDAEGFSLVELAYTGATDPTGDKYWISGRKNDEGAPLWGVDITDNDFWSEGGIILGVSGAADGTYSGGNFIVEPDGDVGIGTTSPATRLEVDGGSVRFSDYGAGTYKDSLASTILGVDTDGDVIELNTLKNTRWFYAPAVTIDASSEVTNETLDLYQQYRDQFTLPSISSTGAPAELPYYESDELHYYITYFDDTVLDGLSIDADGVLTYDIIDVPFDNYTIMNVIFVIK